MKRLVTALPVIAAVLAVALPAPASAAPTCRGSVTPRTIASGLGTLESVIAGPDKRLYFTATSASGDGGRLMRIRRVGDAPKTVTGPITAPGGLAVADRKLILGFGSSIARGLTGNLVPAAGLLIVDPRSGRTEPLAQGLQMANGVARGLDGTIYASSDLGLGIDRIRAGRVERNWASTVSGNGLVVSRDGRTLYAAQTFVPAMIARIPIGDPSAASTFARPDNPADIFAGLDGMTRDRNDRLFVAANLFGEVWRVDRAGEICVVARGLDMPSAVAFGAGKYGFERDNLYAVEFGGRVSELAGALRARPR